MTKDSVQQLTQEQITQQWEVIGLYCVFAFKKDSSRAAHELAAKDGDKTII